MQSAAPLQVMLDDALAELKIQPADAVVVAHSVRAAAAAAMRGAGTVQVTLGASQWSLLRGLSSQASFASKELV